MKSFQICKFNPLCFSTLHRSGSRMLCLSMRTLLPRVTPRISIFNGNKIKIKIKNGPKISEEYKFGCKRD